MRLPRFVKEVLLLVVAFGSLVGSVAAYAGTWPPAVIVESGSMMHRDSEVAFGRYGTIDPGDLVLVKRVRDAGDVLTAAEEGPETYRAPGDVVVYHANGDATGTPIIHRAIAWVELRENATTGARMYEVAWAEGKPCPGGDALPETRPHGPVCVFGSQGITIPELGILAFKPLADGLVTKGDNPVTNPRADQSSGLSTIVKPEWIEGKARGELPWIGLVKLAIAKEENEKLPPAAWWRVGRAYAPPDLWIMLGATGALLVGGPLALDAARAFRRTRERDS